ncbi:acyltransferase family protein [Roseibium suaedae]|nr:acyltransferase [Roseibium suaedae]
MNRAIGTATVRLEQLTGLRFFAALLVFGVHFRWDTSGDFVKSIAEQGYVGVSFFFILSGFVLTQSYKSRILTGATSFRTYFLLRIARLSPLHFLTGLPFLYFSIMQVEAIYSEEFSILKTALNLTYLQSWVPVSSIYFSLNAPSWSLSDEMFFYLSFFFLVAFSPRKLLAITAGLAVVVFVSAFLVLVFLGDTILAGKYPFSHWLFYVFPGFRILEFLVGMVLHDLWKRGIRLPGSVIPFTYVLLFLAMWLAPDIPAPFRYSLFYLPVITLFFYAHLTEGTALTHVFATRPLVLLGNASFAFYLVHQPSLHLLNLFLRPSIPSDIIFFPISLCITTAFSVFLYRIYEMPAERLLKSLINGRRNLAKPNQVVS